MSDWTELQMQALSQAVIAWHRDGVIVELERKWRIPPSDYAARMQANWRRAAGSGPRCGDAVGPATLPECL